MEWRLIGETNKLRRLTDQLIFMLADLLLGDMRSVEGERKV